MAFQCGACQLQFAGRDDIKDHCPGRPGRLSALSVFLCKSVLYGAFVWARRALNHQKRRSPARADRGELHRCNLKRKVAGQASLTHEAFLQRKQQETETPVLAREQQMGGSGGSLEPPWASFLNPLGLSLRTSTPFIRRIMCAFLRAAG